MHRVGKKVNIYLKVRLLTFKKVMTFMTFKIFPVDILNLLQFLSNNVHAGFEVIILELLVCVFINFFRKNEFVDWIW